MGDHGLSFPRQRINYWRTVPRSRHVALKNYTPQLFTICMGTGVLSVLLHQCPYQFRGLGIISVIVWVLDLILFSVIAITFIARWIYFPAATAILFETDVEQTTYLSTTTVAMATLLEMAALVLGSTWNNWQYACYGMWWLLVVLSLVSSMTTYWLLIRDEEVHLSNLTATLNYPTLGLVATALTGSVIVNYTPISVKMAMPVIIVGFMLLGAGFFLSVLTLSAYFLRLLSNQMPSPHKVATNFIPIGALANAVYCYSSFAYLAGPKKHIFESYGTGPLSDPAVAYAMYAAGFIFSITIFGFATIWLILALTAFIRDFRKTQFSLTMWSAAYPIGAYGVACTQLAIDLESTAFKIVATIVLVVLVIFWLLLIAYTVPSLISGELLLKGAKAEMDEEKRKEQEGKGEGERHRGRGQEDGNEHEDGDEQGRERGGRSGGGSKGARDDRSGNHGEEELRVRSRASDVTRV